MSVRELLESICLKDVRENFGVQQDGQTVQKETAICRFTGKFRGKTSFLKRLLLVFQGQISWGCNDNITERNEVHLCWGTFIGNLSSLGIYLQWEAKLLKRCKINALLNLEV